MIEQVLSYRETLKAHMVRVFKSLYPKADYIPTQEARRRIEDILGLDSRYFYGRMLTEAVETIRYKKVKYCGRMLYRPRRRTRHG